MADKKISQLSSASALTGAEPLAIVQDGVTKKTTVKDVANLSTLFANGLKIIESSGDYILSSADAGYCLVTLEPGTNIITPTPCPFNVGDIVGVAADRDTTTIDVIQLLAAESEEHGEVFIMQCVDVGGEKSMFPLSAIKDDNGTLKTINKYLYDNGDYNWIPLTGTTSGNPVTGDISYGVKDLDANKIFAENADGNISGLSIGQYFDDNTEESNGAGIFYKGLVSNANTGFLGVKQDGSPLLSFADEVNFSSLVLDLSNFAVSSDNNSFQGINGNQDFSPNYEDFSYTQKIYVGFRGTATLEDGTVTVLTDKVKTGYKIYVSANTPSGTQGFLSARTDFITDGVSFVINSTSATDDSTVNWWIAP